MKKLLLSIFGFESVLLALVLYLMNGGITTKMIISTITCVIIFAICAIIIFMEEDTKNISLLDEDYINAISIFKMFADEILTWFWNKVLKFTLIILGLNLSVMAGLYRLDTVNILMTTIIVLTVSVLMNVDRISIFILSMYLLIKSWYYNRKIFLFLERDTCLRSELEYINAKFYEAYDHLIYGLLHKLN